VVKTPSGFDPRGRGKPRDFPTRPALQGDKKAAGFDPKTAFSGILPSKLKSPVLSHCGATT